MSRGPGVFVAVLALLTAAIGLVSSPIWGPHVCHAIGVCTSSDTVAKTPTAGATATRAPGWTCPGGTFCGWDGPDGSGEMIIEVVLYLHPVRHRERVRRPPNSLPEPHRQAGLPRQLDRHELATS